MWRASSPANPAEVSRARTSSSGLSIPGGRCPSGVANGRVTSSGTTLGCARANWRKLWATVRSWPAQSGSVDVHRELFEDDLGDAVEHCGLVRDVAVQHHRISAQCVAEAAHGQSVHTVAVDDRQRRLQDHRPAELIRCFGRRPRTGVTVDASRRARSAVLPWPRTSLLLCCFCHRKPRSEIICQRR